MNSVLALDTIPHPLTERTVAKQSVLHEPAKMSSQPYVHHDLHYRGISGQKMLSDIEAIEKPEIVVFLKLLCFLGGVDVPLSMLWRAKSPRKVWGRNGEIEDIVETELQVDPPEDKTEIDHFARQLSHWGVLEMKKGEGEEQLFTIDPALQIYVQHFMPNTEDWKLQALILVCHTFPRDRDLETS